MIADRCRSWTCDAAGAATHRRAPQRALRGRRSWHEFLSVLLALCALGVGPSRSELSALLPAPQRPWCRWDPPMPPLLLVRDLAPVPCGDSHAQQPVSVHWDPVRPGIQSHPRPRCSGAGLPVPYCPEKPASIPPPDDAVCLPLRTQDTQRC